MMKAGGVAAMDDGDPKSSMGKCFPKTLIEIQEPTAWKGWRNVTIES